MSAADLGPELPGETVADALARVLCERDQLRRQRDELQASNTRLVLERRALDLPAMVREFHEAAGAPVLEAPRVPGDDRVRLRLRLIVEECFEALEACGLDFAAPGTDMSLKSWLMHAIDNHPLCVDLPAFADACGDIDYVVAGTRLEFGINGAPIAAEIHAANMRKFPTTVDERGKVLKSASWVGPDVAGRLREQGWTGEGR
jgi:predicted HAD superfamily Cof-like phosphohydrolase